MPRGGKRPGAGRPKGSKSKSTLAREARLRGQPVPKEVTLVVLARKSTPEVIHTLLDILGSDKEKAADRIAAARIILERGWGTARQPPSMWPDDGTDELSSILNP